MARTIADITHERVRVARRMRGEGKDWSDVRLRLGMTSSGFSMFRTRCQERGVDLEASHLGDGISAAPVPRPPEAPPDPAPAAPGPVPRLRTLPGGRVVGPPGAPIGSCPVMMGAKRWHRVLAVLGPYGTDGEVEYQIGREQPRQGPQKPKPHREWRIAPRRDRDGDTHYYVLVYESGRLIRSLRCHSQATAETTLRNMQRKWGE